MLEFTVEVEAKNQRKSQLSQRDPNWILVMVEGLNYKC